MGHVIPSEASAQTSGGGASSSDRNTSPPAPREMPDVGVARRISASSPPTQEEQEDGEDTDMEDDASTDGAEDGKGDAIDCTGEGGESAESRGDNKTTPPLTEYIINVMHFLDSILSNNSTDDHILEFVNQGGLIPLLKLLSLPMVSLDFPMSTACLAISGPCRNILVCCC